MTNEDWNKLETPDYAHLGKYEGELRVAEFVHTLDVDEEAGSCSEMGTWFGILRGALVDEETSSVREVIPDVTEDELAFLRNASGAIVTENDQGFVSVDWYGPEDKGKLESDWSGILADVPADFGGNADPVNPDEDDITADDPGGPFFYNRKEIAANRRDLVSWMEAEGYFPNVWWISDHGNAHLIKDLYESVEKETREEKLATSNPDER
jgi:hypothetical protein